VELASNACSGHAQDAEDAFQMTFLRMSGISPASMPLNRAVTPPAIGAVRRVVYKAHPDGADTAVFKAIKKFFCFVHGQTGNGLV
jgi:hypothetical protein